MFRLQADMTMLILLQTSLSLLACLEKTRLIDDDSLKLWEEIFKWAVDSLVKKVEDYKREKSDKFVHVPDHGGFFFCTRNHKQYLKLTRQVL